MNRKDATHRLVRRYPGGIEAMAGRMQIRADTLRKKLTGVSGYLLDVDEEEQIVDLCAAANVPDVLAPLTAQAVNRGALLIPLPQVAGGSTGATLQHLARCAKEFAEFAGAMAQAEADGSISANELKRIERESGELVSCIQQCVVTAQREHQADRAAREAART